MQLGMTLVIIPIHYGQS